LLDRGPQSAKVGRTIIPCRRTDRDHDDLAVTRSGVDAIEKCDSLTIEMLTERFRKSRLSVGRYSAT
jgi:hypothetical protein